MKSKLKWFRRGRIFFSLLFFALLCVQFLDVYSRLPDVWHLYHPAKYQFVPALLNFMGAGSVVAAAAFCTLIVGTLLFGRVYCSFFCGFGILMDIFRGIFTFPARMGFLKKIAVGKFVSKHFAKLHYAPAWNGVRAAAVIFALLCIIFGWTALLGLIEPYSLYGKVMGMLAYTGVVSGINELSTYLMETHQVYDLISPIGGNVAMALPAFGFALFVLIAIALLSAKRGRFYCNTLCPVGGFLGLLSRYSLFRMELDPEACIKCGLCERACKAQCIQSKEKKLDFTRCVLCFDCASVCAKGAIRFVPRWKRRNESLPVQEKKISVQKTSSQSQIDQDLQKQRVSIPAASTAGMSRRAFAGTLPAAGALLWSAWKVKEGQVPPPPEGSSEPYKIFPDASPYHIPGTRPDKRLPIPPGAVDMDHYFSHCTGCQLCVTACESHMLKPSITEWGLRGFMQPFLDFTKGFCLHECIACSEVCPVGAIRPLTVEEKKIEKIGTAILREELCVVKKDETDCSACGEHCPVTAIEMLPYKPEKHLYIPHVHEDVCIGCGACEFICPVTPHKALVVQGLKKTLKAKVFEESMRLYIPPETAPQENDAEPAAPVDPANPFPF